jgi:hypothetical protein
VLSCGTNLVPKLIRVTASVNIARYMEEHSDLSNSDSGLVHGEAVPVTPCSENDAAIDEVLKAAEKDDDEDDEVDHMKAESAEDDEESEPPPERRSRRAPKPSVRGLEYIAQRPSLLPQSSVNNEANGINSLNKSERAGARKSSGSTSNSENNQGTTKIGDGHENSDINLQDVVLINVGVSAGKEAVVISRRSAGRFHLRVINNGGARVGETIMRRPSFTFMRRGGANGKSNSVSTEQATSDGTACEKSAEDLLKSIISSSCGELDAEVNLEADISMDIPTNIPVDITTNIAMDIAKNPSDQTEQSASQSASVPESESLSESESECPDVRPAHSPVQDITVTAVVEEISSMINEAKSSRNDIDICAVEDIEHSEVVFAEPSPEVPPHAAPSSTVQSSILQKTSLYAPSSPSDASIFSIDSPGSSSPCPGGDLMDVDGVVDDLFDSIDRGNDGKAQEQGWKGGKFSKGKSKGNSKGKVRSEGRDSKGIEGEDGEEDDDEDDEDDDRPAAGSHMFKKYVRLSTGAYHGRIARVTSLSKTHSRYSVNILSNEGSRVPPKHTTVISDSVRELDDADCSDGERAMIERDREMVIEKEIQINKSIERSNLRKLELERERKERAQSRAKSLSVESDGEGKMRKAAFDILAK